MLKRSLMAAAFLYFLTSNAHCADHLLSFVGKAYALNKSKLLYIEYHEIEKDSEGNYLRGTVNYNAPDGQVIARKVLDFDRPLLPTLTFVDLRNNRETRIKDQNGKRVLIRKVEDDYQTTLIDIEDKKRVVADAGFDRLVIQYWDKLMEGKTVKFDVLALTRGKLIEFEIERINSQGDIVSFAIRPRSWLIDLLMAPIELDYRIGQKRLAEYRGITNVAESTKSGVSDDHYRARIVYEYGDDDRK